MRDAEKQEEFLKRGRFGEGEETLGRLKVDPLFLTGLFFLLTAAAVMFAPLIAFGPVKGGGYYSLIVFIASGGVGVLLCICGLVRMRYR